MLFWIWLGARRRIVPGKFSRPVGPLVSTVSTPSQEKATLFGVRAWKMQTRMRADELTLLGDLIASGETKVVVEKVLPLSRAAEALEISRRDHPRGRIV